MLLLVGFRVQQMLQNGHDSAAQCPVPLAAFVTEGGAAAAATYRGRELSAYLVLRHKATKTGVNGGQQQRSEVFLYILVSPEVEDKREG